MLLRSLSSGRLLRAIAPGDTGPAWVVQAAGEAAGAGDLGVRWRLDTTPASLFTAAVTAVAQLQAPPVPLAEQLGLDLERLEPGDDLGRGGRKPVRDIADLPDEEGLHMLERRRAFCRIVGRVRRDIEPPTGKHQPSQGNNQSTNQ